MKPWSVEECAAYAKQLRDKSRANTAEHAAQAIEYLLALRQAEKQEPQHDYRTRYDRGCYKCGSHYCPADCPEPPHLVRQQPQQEPMAWRWKERINGDFDSWVVTSSEPPPYASEKQPLYTAPPPHKPWVGLTGDEVNEFAAGCHLGNSVQGAIRKAEAKIKEKNT